ncbi:LysR family transcriptional regulator [Brevibacillus sp. 7WMA2]|uniref:Transcriptional regulator CysL n=1 Tax=Brevibacillus laterosporus LMG 15441 TaxID=1042163 RepID=A0A075R6Q8_BRELA|nr:MULTISPECIES: LysR family transcriptional regulator [Brevibacillus]WPS86118.1 LysR family transcriptional regulator [Brevibacillus halotolerans]AIG27141.1 transcriptional regulator CysL [Brevibacillus laterosporus LMG 15441]AUM65547.1 LysR family transcriptional regulator [Brevibacillus laterosporus]ERM15820.1 transcriptional regulator [Brevibacillus laterosporus PE36]MCR8993403.1 LysR family transcriptional regulator [Brevibacillus laterosporus]
MNFDSLRIFVKVVEKQNFSRAAEELNLSQPAVSLHIRNLEEEFDTSFIIRSPKHVRVTRAGELFYQKAKQILYAVDETRLELQALKQEVSGLLSLGASYTIGEYFLPKQLVMYTKEYPKVQTQVKINNTREIIEALIDEKIDVGLIEGSISSSDVDVQVFMEDQLVLLVPNDHSLARKKVATQADLENQVWIFREFGSGTREQSDQIIQELGIQVKRYYEFSSSQAVKEAVMAGLGLSIVSGLIAKREVFLKECKALAISSNSHKRLFSLITKKGRPKSRAAQFFEDMILQSPELEQQSKR